MMLLRNLPLVAAACFATLPLLGQDPAQAPATPKTADKAASTAPAADDTTKATRVLVLTPAGSFLDLPERGADLTALLLGGGGQPKDFYEFLGKIDGLAAAEAQHILLDLTHGMSFNLAQLAEMDRAIQRLRKSGKKLWAYLEGANSAAYQLAAGCDRILMADLGILDLPAPALSVTFLKDAMDLLGVQYDVVRCGDFKGAVEPFVLPKMSDHLRKHYLAMVDSMNRSVVDRIARGRNIPSVKVRDFQAQRVFTAQDALAAGLVDQLVPWVGAREGMKKAWPAEDLSFGPAFSDKKEKKSINPLQLLTQLLNPKEEKEDEDSEPTVAVLHLSGGIVDGHKAVSGSIVSMPTVKEIERLIADDSVKGVVVRVNSPGGSATASEAILIALRELSAKKPVVVSMGDVAGSGGYYVTCLGRPIFAEEGTITGSIGVFGMKPNVGALMRRVGLHSEIVALDDSAGMNAMDRGWNDSERGRVQGFVNRIYDVFVGHVARSRGMTTSEVLAIAGGRVWSGTQAVEIGLVDRIGGLHDAIALVAKEAKLEPGHAIRHTPRPKSLIESLTADMLSARALLPDTARLLVAKNAELDRALQIFLDALDGKSALKVWALTPDVLRF
jgi:protease-4